MKITEKILQIMTLQEGYTIIRDSILVLLFLLIIENTILFKIMSISILFNIPIIIYIFYLYIMLNILQKKILAIK